MKTRIIFLIIAFLPIIAPAADPSSTGSEQREFPADYHEVDTDSEVGRDIRKYAEDAQEGALQNFGRQFVHDN